MYFEIKDTNALRLAMQELSPLLERERILSERIFDVRLAVNELVGNVLKHTAGVAKLRGTLQGDFMEITVYSATPFTPPKNSCCSDVYAEHGRGLFLIDSVSEVRTTTSDGGICIKIKIK